MTPGPGIEPRPHWWEASALTTAPPLPPMGDSYQECSQSTDGVYTGKPLGIAFNPQDAQGRQLIKMLIYSHLSSLVAV